MNIQLAAPGKTFLIGEYLALRGEPSLVATTYPMFRLNVSWNEEGHCEGIHPSSPAGQWLRVHRDTFRAKDLLFFDPYEGRGGLGASSAQFLLVHRLGELLQSVGEGSLVRTGSHERLLRDYLEVAGSEDVVPSGADLLAQNEGGLAVVKKNPVRVQSFHWPFTEGSFVIVRTGKKVATHEHLQNVVLNDNLSSLRKANEQALATLVEKDWQAFVEAVRLFGEELHARGWVASHTEELLNEMNGWSETLAAKGCGALGADTIALFVAKDDEGRLHERLRQLGLTIVAGPEAISPVGVTARFQWSDGLKMAAQGSTTPLFEQPPEAGL